MVDKPDPTGIGMTEKIFAGPLDRQLRDALSYIKNYIIKEKVIKLPDQAEAVRIFNLPYAAVEESLSNAIYHKSYQIGEVQDDDGNPSNGSNNSLSIYGPGTLIIGRTINQRLGGKGSQSHATGGNYGGERRQPL